MILFHFFFFLIQLNLGVINQKILSIHEKNLNETRNFLTLRINFIYGDGWITEDG